MCGVVMRGAVALPGSEATSRTKGSRWNLGDLVWPAVAVAIPGRGRKARSRSCRGTGEESDEPRSTGDAPEQGRDERRRRAWREGGSVGGMVDDWRCSGRRNRTRHPVPVACLRIGAAEQPPRSPDRARPPARARCGKAARRDLCGGQGEIPVPTATAAKESIGTPTPLSQRKAKRGCAPTRARFRSCVVEDPGMYVSSSTGNRETSTPGLNPGVSGPHREGDEPKPMMHGDEGSVSAMSSL